MTEIQVQVVPKPSSAGNIGNRPSLPESLASRVDEIGDTLREVADGLQARLGELSRLADPGWNLGEVCLKFSLSLQAGTGVIIAAVSTSATFEASLKWTAAAPAAPQVPGAPGNAAALLDKS